VAGRAILRALLYAALIFFMGVTLMPLVWLVAAAFKSPDAFFSYTFFPPPWKTEDYTLGNFAQLFGQIPFLRFLMNSFFVSGTAVMVQLFFASLGGFALAKYDFRGKRLIMAIMLATMMIPSQVLLAPLYELIYRIHLVDSYFGLIVPGMVSVFGMFLFRQSMMQIPDDLLQAGRIDGCSEFGLYWNIAMPVSRPMVGAFCLISFMGNWNAFLWPQIILHTRERFTLPIGLNQMVGLYHQDYGVLMAGTLLSVLPVVILFFVLQKEFIAGLTAGAVKG
jgi:ABC-type glycerol-3-phosphate transport system permease component